MREMVFFVLENVTNILKCTTLISIFVTSLWLNDEIITEAVMKKINEKNKSLDFFAIYLKITIL